MAEAKLGMRAEVQSSSALSELIARITGRPQSSLSSNTTLEGELNMSSLDRVELMSALEGRYQVDLSETKDVYKRQILDGLKNPKRAKGHPYGFYRPYGMADIQLK